MNDDGLVQCVIGVDPGYKHSAFVALSNGRVLSHKIMPNDELVALLKYRMPTPGTTVVVEQFEGMGMAVGREVMETIWWSGRFFEAWPGARARVTRREVKLHLCGLARAKDSNVRQALIDRFGPDKETAIGKKSAPGPLYGVKADEWAALAVAVTWWDVTRTG